ncbi:MAG: histone deacetylase [Acidimicrobiia bacterium]|nr:histone deacetylase [Acidimicrobiia bacterium]
MTVLFTTHPRYLEHETGTGHPERPARLQAVLDGVRASGVEDAVVRVEARAATRAEVERVHPRAFLDALERFCAGGGGDIDGDTVAVPASWDAALLAAGAGLDAIERLDRGEADAAFCAVRPPGHHATPDRAMGFCLLSNVAIAAAALADRGERVAIVDYDAHHGNGTQAAFESDPRVLYVSFHESPLYPGTGAMVDVGTGAGRGTTVNVPLPSGATGDVYRAGIEVVVAPRVREFAPTWLLISAGFDAHRADPLTSMGLTSGDFADLTRELVGLVPPGRVVAFLEGGYDLEALAHSTAATLAALAGVELHPEAPTTGGPGRDVIDRVALLHLS